MNWLESVVGLVIVLLAAGLMFFFSLPQGARSRVVLRPIRAMQRLRRNRTTFVIAHRLSTVRDADRILVLDAGRLVAAGTHQTLMETSPLYREMARSFEAQEQTVVDRRGPVRDRRAAN